ITILFLFSFDFGQDQIVFNANSGSPVLKKEARILELKKVLSLDGDSDLYQFKDPERFDIGEDGSIFVLDWNRALYKFSAEGKFQMNLFKKGEGPGELKRLFRFFLTKLEVIQYCHFPNKIVIKNFRGELQHNNSIPEKGPLSLIGVDGNTYIFSKNSPLNFLKNITDKLQEISYKNYFYNWRSGEKVVTRGKIFYTEYGRFKKYPGGGMTGSRSPANVFTISNVKNGLVYFINSFDYKVIKLNIHDLKIKNEFGRSYESVKYFHPESYLMEMKKVKKSVKDPEKKHFKNVLKLFNRKNELWVVTSTYIKNKGILVDVFSHDGVYKDKFYLPIQEITSPHLPELNIIDAKIVVLGKDEDENHIVNVYEIQHN
ncbi:MAG: hypothetical protein KAS97_13800, partial [Candidatus Aminicenantes bacterium]|nr:hypothetical protein [Candidatus Aminicenantes bacterium]